MDLWFIALAVSFWIFALSVIVAKQEIAVEGPFGWSAATFTKRVWPTSFFSRIFRLLAGQDKWATHYHLYANLVWIFIFFGWLFLLPLWWHLAGGFSFKTLAYSFIISACSASWYMCTEDFYWFLLNPYYGPERFSKRYIPWHQDYAGGLPIGYVKSAVATLAITLGASLFCHEFMIFNLWLKVLIITGGLSFLLYLITRRQLRKPLRPYWWTGIKEVSLVPCPYAVQDPWSVLTAPQVRVMDQEGQWQDLDSYLAPK